MKVHSFEVISVNLNDAVAVRLTARGWNIVAQGRRAAGAPEPGSCIGDTLPGGYYRFQLWDLIATFAPYMQIGMEPPLFEGNDFFLIDPIEQQLRRGGAA
jgi:hypothetical protein